MDEIPHTAEGAAEHRDCTRVTIHRAPIGIGPPESAMDYARSARCPDCLVSVELFWRANGWAVQIQHDRSCPLDGARRQHPSSG